MEGRKGDRRDLGRGDSRRVQESSIYNQVLRSDQVGRGTLQDRVERRDAIVVIDRGQTLLRVVEDVLLMGAGWLQKLCMYPGGGAWAWPVGIFGFVPSMLLLCIHVYSVLPVRV